MTDGQQYFESLRIITPCQIDMEMARSSAKPHPHSSLVQKVVHYANPETWRAMYGYRKYSRERQRELQTGSYRA